MSDQPKGQPRQPQHPTPQAGESVASNPHGQTPHGIPEGAEQADPKGRPSGDREASETAPAKARE